MRYDEPVYRPPSEANSLIIQATIGCPHNKCEFCFMYKGKKFKKRPLGEIKEDIAEAKELYGDYVRTVFLADGNTIILKTEDLLEIVNFCYAMFPKLDRVTSYGAAKFILRTKTVEDLKRLRKAGLKRLHMGLESGNDLVLESICKGATSEEMIKAGRMVKEAGMELSEYVLLGIGGQKLWKEHAVDTARVLNAIDPDFIRVRTLVLRPDAPLWKKLKAGEFVPVTRKETLMETRLLVEKLDCHSEFWSDHVSNIADVNGKLPEDKGRMLEKLDELIEKSAGEPEDREWAVDQQGIRCL
jgi:radical SAM superfamily enzyme YgiQ (UPF0313 family)